MEWKIRENMHTLQWEGGAGWGIQNWWRLGEIPLLLISCIFISRNDATLGRLWKFPEITPIKMSPVDSYTYLHCWWCGECDPFWSKLCQTMWNRHQPPTDACLWDSQCVTNNLQETSGGTVSECCQNLKAIMSRLQLWISQTWFQETTGLFIIRKHYVWSTYTPLP